MTNNQLSLKYIELCKHISAQVKVALIDRLKATGFIGDKTTNPNDLKSTHEIDKVAISIITQELKRYRCNLFMESYAGTVHEDADFSIFIDPIDGSLNWDRGIGDPCIAFAISEKSKNIKFKELSFAYVEGLRSGDFYFTEDEKSFFVSKATGQRYQNTCEGNQRLSEAICYLRPGYSLAKPALEGSFPLFLECKDIRAVENSGMELCEIARNAADVMVETRGASDFYNLLAFPILRNAGGIICSLEGRDIGDTVIDVNATYDFIAGNNKQLMDKVLIVLSNYRSARSYSKDGLTFKF